MRPCFCSADRCPYSYFCLRGCYGAQQEAVTVEESYYPRNTQGVILSIRLNSQEGVEALRDAFTPQALESITVGEGDTAKTITGYTQIDSIRKLYGGDAGYDTGVDLVKGA